jgi:enoyl-CoA hydratase/carnithine racemase
VVVVDSWPNPSVPAAAEPAAHAGIRLDVAGQVTTVSLIRPERRNAQTPSMWSALREVGDSLPPDVRIVVVRGEGISFSAGLDLRLLRPGGVPGEASFVDIGDLDDAQLLARVEAAQAAFTWLRRPEITTIAAVQGHAFGAGFQLALACDLRVFADDVELCMLETRLGMAPDLGGSQPLVELVGISRALEIFLTGRRIGAVEAQAIGLANAVVPAAELESTVDRLVATLLETPRDSATATKALLRGASTRPLEDQLQAERQAAVRRLRVLFGNHSEGESP